jgi:hypothetical protein
MDSCLAENTAHYLSSFEVAAGRPVVHLVKNGADSHPVFAKDTRLPLAQRGKLVIVLLQVGGLTMAD